MLLITVSTSSHQCEQVFDVMDMSYGFCLLVNDVGWVDARRWPLRSSTSSGTTHPKTRMARCSGRRQEGLLFFQGVLCSCSLLVLEGRAT